MRTKTDKKQTRKSECREYSSNCSMLNRPDESQWDDAAADLRGLITGFLKMQKKRKSVRQIRMRN